MTMRTVAAFAAALTGLVALTHTPVHALTMQECSAKYKAAQTAGTAKGMKWNDFRKAECGAETPAATPAPAPAGKTATPPAKAPVPAATGGAVYPTAVAPKHSGESAGKARMQTCLDQYNANKATNANGGLNWIQKGGGFYSECNKRLKE